MKYNKQENFNKVNMFGLGQANEMFAQYFVGESYLNPLTNPQTDGIFIANVTFEPGCRNNWHTHTASNGGGQIILCTAGEGWYQEEGKDAVELKEGSVIVIPANIKHWHGAKKDSWFSHIAFTPAGEDMANEWHEEVSDAHYNSLED